jgi:hypothetical protein
MVEANAEVVCFYHIDGSASQWWGPDDRRILTLDGLAQGGALLGAVVASMADLARIFAAPSFLISVLAFFIFRRGL